MTIRLTWPTRDDGPIDTRGARLATESPRVPDAAGRLIVGDNLAALRALIEEGLEGKVGLVYLDPPYMSGVDYAHETKKGKRTHAYGDRWPERGHYLDMMLPRLRLLHRLLAPHGTLWVQLDHRATFLVHALLDEIFGPEKFRNAIVWRRAPPLGRQVRSGQFPRNVDTLVAYARGDKPRFHPLSTPVLLEDSKARYDEKRDRWYTLAPRGDYTDTSIERLDAEGRVHRSDAGKVYIKYFVERAADGKLYKPRSIDGMWDDIAPLRHVSPTERTGYPTQKPERLLQRIVESTSDEGDLVLDPFAGSGTTAIVSAKLGRPFIAIDASPIAIETAEQRLGQANVRFQKQTVRVGLKAGKAARA